VVPPFAITILARIGGDSHASRSGRPVLLKPATESTLLSRGRLPVSDAIIEVRYAAVSRSFDLWADVTSGTTTSSHVS
jgi:hypothetical protein